MPVVCCFCSIFTLTNICLYIRVHHFVEGNGVFSAVASIWRPRRELTCAERVPRRIDVRSPGVHLSWSRSWTCSQPTPTHNAVRVTFTAGRRRNSTCAGLRRIFGWTSGCWLAYFNTGTVFTLYINYLIPGRQLPRISTSYVFKVSRSYISAQVFIHQQPDRSWARSYYVYLCCIINMGRPYLYLCCDLCYLNFYRLIYLKYKVNLMNGFCIGNSKLLENRWNPNSCNFWDLTSR